ncbi:hypothetical protein BBD41_29060 [Paenibacillus ihbetae]|uniref:Uncharacterized protein n=2 Tax=Paenibacillus ihbetae TaxID=1870820 RepID=A0A1B2E8J9_9BACL|nr:hypothetical protein BBD41_29060 [Paenibacillus ihbetae]
MGGFKGEIDRESGRNVDLSEDVMLQYRFWLYGIMVRLVQDAEKLTEEEQEQFEQATSKLAPYFEKITGTANK